MAWEIADRAHPERPGPRVDQLADVGRAIDAANGRGRLFARWTTDDKPTTYTPVMGWQSCRYVFDGTDAEDGDYYRCVVHDCLTLGHEVSCEKAGDNEKETGDG